VEEGERTKSNCLIPPVAALRPSLRQGSLAGGKLIQVPTCFSPFGPLGTRAPQAAPMHCCSGACPRCCAHLLAGGPLRSHEQRPQLGSGTGRCAVHFLATSSPKEWETSEQSGETSALCEPQSQSQSRHAATAAQRRRLGLTNSDRLDETCTSV